MPARTASEKVIGIIGRPLPPPGVSVPPPASNSGSTSPGDPLAEPSGDGAGLRDAVAPAGARVAFGLRVGFGVGFGVAFGFTVGLGVGFGVGLGVGFGVGLGVGVGAVTVMLAGSGLVTNRVMPLCPPANA